MKLLNKIFNKLKEIIKDQCGSPLMEEALLIGVSLLMISLLLAMVLDVVGWAQNTINSIYNEFDKIERSVSGNNFFFHFNSSTT